jgi:small subunit ribosomal protein S14
LQAVGHRFKSDCLQFIITKVMKYRLLKDRRRRILHASFERRRIVLRSIMENFALPFALRGQAYRALLLLPRDSSMTRKRNRCALTGRSRAIVRKFGLSRLIFRQLALTGKLIGVKKAS